MEAPHAGPRPKPTAGHGPPDTTASATPAGAGATALGSGAAGGVGASDGVDGIPIALGFDPDAVALTSIATPATGSATERSNPPTPLFAVAIALDGSRAQVATADSTVVCLARLPSRGIRQPARHAWPRLSVAGKRHDPS